MKYRFSICMKMHRSSTSRRVYVSSNLARPYLSIRGKGKFADFVFQDLLGQFSFVLSLRLLKTSIGPLLRSGITKQRFWNLLGLRTSPDSHLVLCLLRFHHLLCVKFQDFGFNLEDLRTDRCSPPSAHSLLPYSHSASAI